MTSATFPTSLCAMTSHTCILSHSGLLLIPDIFYDSYYYSTRLSFHVIFPLLEFFLDCLIIIVIPSHLLKLSSRTILYRAFLDLSDSSYCTLSLCGVFHIVNLRVLVLYLITIMNSNSKLHECVPITIICSAGHYK